MIRQSGLKTCCIVCVTALLTAGEALAVDIYDGVRAPRGLYFLSYSSIYLADVFTDADGHTATDALGYRSVTETLRLCWYSPNVMLTVLAPVAYVDSANLDDDDFDIGDTTLGAGGFLPIRSFDCLALLAADLPTGDSDVGEASTGTGQYNIRPSLFVHKEARPYTADGVVKYNFRQENHDTGSHPGDEFIAEMLATRQFGRFKIGPGINWVKGKDNRQDGDTIPDSARQVVSAGGEAYFKLGGWSTTLHYMADVYSENAARGHLFKIKFCRKF